MTPQKEYENRRCIEQFVRSRDFGWEERRGVVDVEREGGSRELKSKVEDS